MALVTAAVAAGMDLYMGKVKNWWIGISLLTGILVKGIGEGPEGLISFFEGFLVPFVCLIAFFYFRMLGAGDIKLFCVLGGFLGVSSILSCMGISVLIGGVISIAIFLRTRILRKRLLYFVRYFHHCFRDGKPGPYIKEGSWQPENVHFTIPILLSILFYIFVGGF